MKIGVLTDSESASGYRLAGLSVAVAADGVQAREVLARMIQEGTYALIAVSMALLPDPYQAAKREIHGRDIPVLMALPSPFPDLAGKREDAEAYVRRLIIAAIGYEIKLQAFSLKQEGI